MRLLWDLGDSTVLALAVARDVAREFGRPDAVVVAFVRLGFFGLETRVGSEGAFSLSDKI